MRIEKFPIPKQEQDEGLRGDEITVIDLSAAEILNAAYVEIHVDGVRKCQVRIAPEG